MTGISTCWRSAESTDGNELLDAFLDLGFNTLEIDYRVGEDELKQVKRRLMSSEFNVLSVHNFCPLPRDIPKSEANGDLFVLSARDREERRIAVKHATRTLQLAADLEASAVVFHCGFVEMDEELERLFGYFEDDKIDSDIYRNWFTSKIAERREKAHPHFDSVLKSLDELNEKACRLGVLIGVENRYRYDQIPFREEYDIIFREFEGGNVRYWHDVGHAEIFHRLEISNHYRDFLDRYREQLAGVHIHDIRGLEDHLAPGQGSYDFKRLEPYLEDFTIRILEIHPKVGKKEAQNGVELLKSQGL